MAAPGVFDMEDIAFDDIPGTARKDPGGRNNYGSDDDDEENMLDLPAGIADDAPDMKEIVGSVLREPGIEALELSERTVPGPQSFSASSGSGVVGASSGISARPVGPQDFELRKVLGKGGYGKVRRGCGCG